MANKIGPILDEMLEAIDAIREATSGKTFAQFERERLTRLAVQRAIEISEAARRLPDTLLVRHPQLEWRKIRAIGNVLRHEYHRISDRIIWQVAQQEMDPLAAVLEAEKKLCGPGDADRTGEE
jgi:uncharacterized protein with HEPN domain